MRIMQIAAIEETVPPSKYGGTELVVSNVTEGMVERGHEVFLLAAGNSKTAAHLVPLAEKSLREMYPIEEMNMWRKYYNVYLVSEVLRLIDEIKPDVIHNHLSWRLVLFSDFIKIPMFHTIHGPVTDKSHQIAYNRFPKANYISISDYQRTPMPHLNWVKTVYNGIDVNKFELGEENREYFAFLGRVSPEKGLAEICKMIKSTNEKLKIAAKIDQVDLEYYDKEIKPFIDGNQIEYVGEVDHIGKNELLKNAKGLLAWPNWPEPFGLAIVEALACGTPVFVNRLGSMPELMIDGKSGFLVDSIEEMKAKLGDVKMIDPVFCREHVVKNFAKEKMVDDYLDVALSLID